MNNEAKTAQRSGIRRPGAADGRSRSARMNEGATAFFVTRAKSNTQFRQHYSSPVDRSTTSVICDQTGVLTVFYANNRN